MSATAPIHVKVVLTFSSKEAAERLYNMEQRTYYNPKYYIDSLKIDSIYESKNSNKSTE